MLIANGQTSTISLDPVWLGGMNLVLTDASDQNQQIPLNGK